MTTDDHPQPTPEELERGRRAFALLPQDHRFERESAKLSREDQRCVAVYLRARLLGQLGRSDNEKTPPERGFRYMGDTGLEPVTSALSRRRSPS